MSVRAIRFLCVTVLCSGFCSQTLFAQKYLDDHSRIHVALVVNPYNGDRAGDEVSTDAAEMTRGGLLDSLRSREVIVESIHAAELNAQQESQYGRWNRFGMANGNLAAYAAENEKAGHFNIGFYNNCSSLSGMLGGLQQSGKDGEPLTIGLIWIDAHGDYNTPETTLSGMLGGMPVAVAAGHALARMRKQSGLEVPLPTEHIIMAGVRDTDPLEQERIDSSNIRQITVNDLRFHPENIAEEMDRLSRLTDLVYVHIDLDVLDPVEVSGHPLTVPDGPSSRVLADALRLMFSYEKAAALGFASYPENDDPGQLTLKAVHAMVIGALEGIKARTD